MERKHLFSAIKNQTTASILFLISLTLSTTNVFGDTVPGATSGNFRVDESGQATYSLSIATVKGSGKVSPQVGLTYSSQGGNGLLGMGWNISGQSAITRCRQTWEQDKLTTAVNLSRNDRLCLNGQRLILTSTGIYGASGTVYKTEIDSQVEVFAFGGT